MYCTVTRNGFYSVWVWMLDLVEERLSFEKSWIFIMTQQRNHSSVRTKKWTWISVVDSLKHNKKVNSFRNLWKLFGVVSLTQSGKQKSSGGIISIVLACSHAWSAIATTITVTTFTTWRRNVESSVGVSILS